MQLKEFLETSYTAYHTAVNVVKYLEANGFCRLAAGENWQLQTDGKYYVTRNGSSVIAFRLGSNKVFNICESHTDSPSFKIKGNKLAEGDVSRLNTETYGGAILYSFFDRPLKVAGRLLVETDKGVEERLVTSVYDVVIPSLAIHHNPTVNEGVAFNTQSDTLPLFSQSEQELYSTLTDGSVLDADLFVTPSAQAFNGGVNGEFLCSARLDNLTSVYAGVNALVNCKPQCIAVAACLDNEEIGSGTRQGSPSFIDQTLNALSYALGMTESERLYARENGFVLSSDNGHASHPAHPEKYDVCNKTTLNGGVVIKHHVNYATDGLSSAIVKKLMKDNNIKYQDYYNRSNLRCGSTLGLSTARQLGMRVCDVGIAELAMHSACETCGTEDIAAMQSFMTAFLSSGILK